MKERTFLHPPDQYRGTDLSPKRELADDHEMINLTFGIGNHELKALVILAMMLHPEEIHTSPDFNEGFLELLQDRKYKRKNLRYYTPSQYCNRTIAPAKIVERIPFPKILSGEDGYRLTEFGREKAFAFAGHILDFSLHHELSLQEILGGTQNLFSQRRQNPESIPPVKRIKIIEALLGEDQPRRTAEIAKRIGDPVTMSTGNQLKDLDKNGVLLYKASNPGAGEPIVQYRLSVPGLHITQLPREMAHPSFRKLSKKVFDIAYWNEFQGDADWLTRAKVTDILIAQNSRLRKTNRDFLLKQVGKIFAHLRQQDLIDIMGSTETRSDISLTVPQRTTLQDLVDLLHRFQNADDDFIEEGKQKSRDIMNDPEKVRFLIEKASRKKAA